jgi:AraC family transcriptional regulator
MNPLFYSSAQPWITGSKSLIESLSDLIEVDAIAFGLLDMRSPQPHSIIHSEGFTTASLLEWILVGIHKDAVFRESLETGCAQGFNNTGSLSLVGTEGDSFVLHAQTGAGSPNHKWWLAAAQAGAPFSSTQRDTLVHMLHHWQGQLLSPQETGLQQLFVTDDGVILFAGPMLRQFFEQASEAITPFVHLIQGCMDQRWPNCEYDDPHDLVLPLGDTAMWITARKRQGFSSEQSVYWMYECRVLGDNDLPPVGVLSDGRIARALAYMHDYYFDSPSLNDLASHVEISPFHFHRLFAKQVGMSPKQYLLQKQMQMGRWRLRLGLEPIGEIAVATGFANHAHFTSTFRRMFKHAPSEYQLRSLRRIDALVPYGAATEARPALRVRSSSPD